MRTPWINHEEMKRIAITRQTVFFFTVTREHSKLSSDDSKNEVSAEADSNHHELDTLFSGANTDELNNPIDNSDENRVLNPPIKNNDFKEMDVCQVVKKIEEIQTNNIVDIRFLPIDHFTEDYYFNKMADLVNVKQAYQTDVIRETDNNSQGKSRFNFEYISEFDFAPSYIEPVKTFGALGKLSSVPIFEPSKKMSELKENGISKLIKGLKKLQTIHTDDRVKINHVIDSQTKSELVHISIADTALNNIELEESNSLLGETDNPGGDGLDIQNSESKQMSISRLVNTLEKLQSFRAADSFESSMDINVPVIDVATEIDRANDLQIESESAHISITDIAFNDIELDKSSSPLEEADNPGVIELDEENSESKQWGIQRLINTLGKIQTTRSANDFELSIAHNMQLIDMANEIDHVVDSQTETKTETEFEPVLPSESSYIDNEKLDRDDTGKFESSEELVELPQCGKMYCKTIKNPFSTFVEIDDFLHAPLFGEISQNTFEFLDSSNKQSFQLDTKFISTSTYYPEQPSCHLVSSAIHEIIYLTKTLHTNGTKKDKTNSSKSIMIPTHSSRKTGESSHENYTHDLIKIRVPVVVGEYDIEICIEKEVLFEEEVIRIKEVSKKVVLTNCHFTPTQLSKPLGDGTCAASSGVLSIEGLIVQNIEYSAIFDMNESSVEGKEVIHLHEKITLELMVQLLQEQGIRVHYNDLQNYKND